MSQNILGIPLLGVQAEHVSSMCITHDLHDHTAALLFMHVQMRLSLHSLTLGPIQMSL